MGIKKASELNKIPGTKEKPTRVKARLNLPFLSSNWANLLTRRVEMYMDRMENRNVALAENRYMFKCCKGFCSNS